MLRHPLNDNDHHQHNGVHIYFHQQFHVHRKGGRADFGSVLPFQQYFQSARRLGRHTMVWSNSYIDQYPDLEHPDHNTQCVYHFYFNASLVQQYGEGIYVNRGASFDNCSFVADWKDLHAEQVIKSLMPDPLTNVKVKDAVCDYASTLD
jgi:hypothetical protein